MDLVTDEKKKIKNVVENKFSLCKIYLNVFKNVIKKFLKEKIKVMNLKVPNLWKKFVRYDIKTLIIRSAQKYD